MAMTWNGANLVGYIGGVMVVSAAVATMMNDPLYNRVLSTAELAQLAAPP